MLRLAMFLHFVSLGSRGSVCLNGNPTVAEEFKERHAVFAGTGLSERYEPPLDKYFSEEGTTYAVRVDELFKGGTPRTVRIFSENSSGRFPMDVGSKYLLFVYRDHGRMIVDNCGNSEGTA